jgi:hypothetical protein
MMAWTQHDRAAEGEIPACVAGAIPARSLGDANAPSKGERIEVAVRFRKLDTPNQLGSELEAKCSLRES